MYRNSNGEILEPSGSCASNHLVNPHQRCGCSDSPFARIYLFLYCRVQKWVGVDGKDPHLKKKLNFQAVIKSAARAASPKAKIQESRGA